MAFSLSRTHRPARFSDVVGQEPLVKALQEQLRSKRVGHAYLLTGPRGVGKTTVARLLARSVNCEAFLMTEGEPCGVCEACRQVLDGSAIDVFEMDAASHTDVENVREQIIKNSRFTPQRLAKKVFVIDEVHMLSTSAFNALLKTLEEPPEHVLFIFATTDSQKIPATVLSRCQRFDFRLLSEIDLLKRLTKLVETEGREVEREILLEVVRLSDGCVRDAESLLSQLLSLSAGKVTHEDASLVLPLSERATALEILQAVAAHETLQGLRVVKRALERGADPFRILDDLVEMSRICLRVACGEEDSILSSEAERTTCKALVKDVSPHTWTTWLEGWIAAKTRLAYDRIPELALEVMIVELSDVVSVEQKTSVVLGKPIVPATPLAPPPHEAPQETPPLPTFSPQEMAPTEAPRPPVVAQEIPEKPILQPSEIPVSPVPSETQKPAPASSLSQQDIEAKWPSVFQALKSANASLPFIFQNGRVQAVRGNEIEVGFEFAFHADTVNQERHRKVLDQILLQVFGVPLTLKGVYVHASADDTVSELLATFGGSAK